MLNTIREASERLCTSDHLFSTIRLAFECKGHFVVLVSAHESLQSGVSYSFSSRDQSTLIYKGLQPLLTCR
jgi:hypothetical protein